MVKYEVDDCDDHKWDGGEPVRICLLCGEIRDFAGREGSPQIFWPGKNCDKNPKDLPASSKRAIALVAKRNGLKEVGENAGIPKLLLRGWVGAYCRKPKTLKEQAPTPVAKTENVILDLATKTIKDAGKDVKSIMAASPSPAPIEIIHLVKGVCPICGGEVWSSDFDPYYIETKIDGKIWLCAVCGEGLAHMFSLLGIKMVVIHQQCGKKELDKNERKVKYCKN